MTDESVRDIIVALLGVGGATFVWTLVKSYLSIRGSAHTREDTVVGRLERFERECREDLDRERDRSAYWYRVSGILEYHIRINGLDVPPLPKPPDHVAEHVAFNHDD